MPWNDLARLRQRLHQPLIMPVLLKLRPQDRVSSRAHCQAGHIVKPGRVSSRAECQAGQSVKPDRVSSRTDCQAGQSVKPDRSHLQAAPHGSTGQTRAVQAWYTAVWATPNILGCHTTSFCQSTSFILSEPRRSQNAGLRKQRPATLLDSNSIHCGVLAQAPISHTLLDPVMMVFLQGSRASAKLA